MGCGHDSSDFYIHRCSNDAGGSQTGVHALVIGTSKYEYPHEGNSTYENFHNIPGAAFGAGKFARFLGSDEYQDPLGNKVLTIRLLLTPTDDEASELRKSGLTWLLATKDRVATALGAWFRDCDASPNNITILYVAGHGLTRLSSYSHVFLKAEGDEPNPFVHSLNLDVIREALEYNYSQNISLITDCCADAYLQPSHENGILLEPKYERVYVPHKYDTLHIAAARVGAGTYALGALEGTMLSYVLEQLLASAGELVHHPLRPNERYFAITQSVMSERVEPVFRSHPKSKLAWNSCPQIRGQTVAGGLHRPKPPPTFHVEFVVKGTAADNPVNVAITTRKGVVLKSETISPGRPLELDLAAGVYTRKLGSDQAEFDVDRPKRFDALSGDFDLL